MYFSCEMATLPGNTIQTYTTMLTVAVMKGKSIVGRLPKNFHSFLGDSQKLAFCVNVQLYHIVVHSHRKLYIYIYIMMV